MTRYPATIQTRTTLAQAQALEWFAERAGVNTADVVRFFLPARIPSHPDELQELAEEKTLEALTDFAERSIELERNPVRQVKHS